MNTVPVRFDTPQLDATKSIFSYKPYGQAADAAPFLPMTRRDGYPRLERV